MVNKKIYYVILVNIILIHTIITFPALVTETILKYYSITQAMVSPLPLALEYYSYQIDMLYHCAIITT